MWVERKGCRIGVRLRMESGGGARAWRVEGCIFGVKVVILTF